MNFLLDSSYRIGNVALSAVLLPRSLRPSIVPLSASTEPGTG